MDLDAVVAVCRRQLTYFGHVRRMKPERIPARVLNGRIHGSRPRGRPRKRWIDMLEEDCKYRDVTLILT